jgi:hypothetical protein
MREFVRDKGGSVSEPELTDHLNLSPETFGRALRRAKQYGAIVSTDGFIALPIGPEPEMGRSIH